MKMNSHNQLSEAELVRYKDNLYSQSKQGKCDFTNLLEYIMMRENLIEAIRKVKANGGFKTPGVDDMTGQDFLDQDPEEMFKTLEKKLYNYQPNKVKRTEIPKSNGKKRPLGIPTITDRIIQTAVANIIEPIVEAKMYEHSYGFRPLRKIEHATAMISALTTHNQRHFVVEGDIKGYFDNINHRILINKLWKYGIRDKRVLSIIKKMLKAGIEDIKEVNDIGTPQGGTISTLLSNIYLTDFDHWVDRQWREFETEYQYKTRSRKIDNLKKTGLKMGYLIRYADDWIIMTDTEENARKWKAACTKYLKKELQIELSEEKTVITDLRVKPMDFLGIRFFKEPGRNKNWTLRTLPNPDRLLEKKGRLISSLKRMRKADKKEKILEEAQYYNGIVRGLKNFYKTTTLVAVSLGATQKQIDSSFIKTMKKIGAKTVPIESCQNLKNYHKKYPGRKVWAINISNINYGIDWLSMIKYTNPKIKAQWITPYSQEGRDKWEEIHNKKFSTLYRNPFLTLGNISNLIAKNSIDDEIYTIEYFINRPMVFNRDRCACKSCDRVLTGYGDTNIHHIEPELPREKLNKVSNLVTLCIECHIDVHREKVRKARLERQEKAKKRKENATKKKGNSKSSKKVVKSQSSVKPSKEILLQEIKTIPFLQLGKKIWCL